MKKRKYRYFFSFFDTQEKWLNKMASKGWRLVKVTRFYYEFEQCDFLEYEYRVEFAAQYSYEKLKDYSEFLKEMGFKVLTKNININFSFGKIRWRPYGIGLGQIATSPGNYNKEIIIIEKKRDGKAFDLYNNYEDIIRYYNPIRNAYIGMLALLIVVLGTTGLMLQLIRESNILGMCLMITCIGVLLIPILKYSLLIKKYKGMNEINN